LASCGYIELLFSGKPFLAPRLFVVNNLEFMTYNFVASKYRTHHLGELRRQHTGQQVTLSGWVMRKRDHGGLIFIDLRDNYGLTQIVFSEKLLEAAAELRPESVIQVTGCVKERGEGLKNSRLLTGEIEVVCDTLEILSKCRSLPFQVAEEDKAPEALRLKHRYLELRRERLHKNILLRSKIFTAVRRIMIEMGFSEFQTPILTSSSPEGARDFIVPSRLHAGKFYALPQAPQQFKQLLMVSGFDRYFQIAPCFRDEDSRADRSPGEFYQIDLEMSFVEEEDVYAVNSELLRRIFSEFTSSRDFSLPVITYNEAMNRYGTDKPDLRNPLEIGDFSLIFQDTSFNIFDSALKSGGKVRAISVELENIPARKFFDETVESFKQQTGLGLAYLVIESEGVKGTLAKFLTQEELSRIKEKISSFPAVVFVAAGSDKVILPALGKLRDKLGRDFSKLEKDTYRFCWINDYPLYEETEEGGIEFSHNPFTMPQGGLEALKTLHPLQVKGQQYDVVCNGYELGSGGIRNHSPEVMYKAFEIAGYPNEVVDKKFSGLREAFDLGVPPHGGFAFGLDRIVMLILNETAIREVIAFPLAQTGEDLMMGAPSEVSEKQLSEVHIRLREKKNAARESSGS